MNPLPSRGVTSLLPSLGFAALLLLPAMSAQAQVSCSASIDPVSFGSVDFLAGDGLTTTATLTYTCKNTANSSRTAAVCFSLGEPHGQSNSNRYMDKGSEKLYFQMYKDPAHTQIWGSVYSAPVTPVQISVTIPRNSTTSPATLTLYGKISAGQTVSSGTYAVAYGTQDAQVTLSTSSTTCPQTPPSGFSLKVSANVVKSCIVSADADIQIGSVAAATVNASGSNNLRVTCSSGMPYFIGLSPSNGSNTGAGMLSGTVGNADQVPYQLRSTSTSGPIWGNTATTTNIGNGVAGTGNGAAQTIPVFAVAPSADFTPDVANALVYRDLIKFAVAPSADFTPDSYSDMVTVNVNY